MERRLASDIIQPSREASGAIWRLSGDQTECLKSSQRDTNQTASQTRQTQTDLQTDRQIELTAAASVWWWCCTGSEAAT